MPDPVYPNEYHPLKVVTLGGYMLIPPMLPLFKTVLGTPFLAWPSESATHSFDIILSDGKEIFVL